jgi:hypothetical protein
MNYSTDRFPWKPNDGRAARGVETEEGFCLIVAGNICSAASFDYLFIVLRVVTHTSNDQHQYKQVYHSKSQ